MDIQAARERCEAATEGPWLRHQWGTKSQVVEAKVNTETAPGIKMVGQRILAREMLKANAEFVAHARSDLPAALEALEEAQKIVDILKPTMNLGVVQVPPPIQDHDRLYALKDAVNAYDAILGESE